MIDWTFPQQARRTVHRMADQFMAVAEGRCGLGIGRPEDRDDADPQGIGDMHGPGIVREEQPATLDQSHQLPHAGAT